MFATLLALHSLVRWLLLLGLACTVYTSYRGLRLHKEYSIGDKWLSSATTALAILQLAAGILLYSLSPIVDYFLHHFSTAVHQREIRFFGMEHSLVMFVSVVLICTGAIKIKSSASHREKFKTTFTWFGIALFLVLTSIPWAFSPLVNRPYFRPF